MAERTETPTDDALGEALSALRAEHAALGISKLHAALLAAQPTWLVSEKRARKVLQAAGLVLAPPSTSEAPDPAHDGANGGADAPKAASKKKPRKKGGAGAGGAEPGRTYPASRPTRGLDVAQLAPKVGVQQFGGGKGKGLVATAPIAEGELLWKEDPWAVQAEWELFDMQVSSRACAHCTTPLRSLASSPPCAGGLPCAARFCNRLCMSRASAHALLCPARNPRGAAVLALARSRQWIALGALAHTAAKLLAAHSAGDAEFEKDWAVFDGLAVISMDDRAKDGYWGVAPDRKLWEHGHKLFVQAFCEPPSETEKKKLLKLTKRELPAPISAELFSYEGFLRGLGRMNINMEGHGGIYALHSHLNHACAPNVSVRHLDRQNALARIQVIARAPVAPGEELTAAYVNPDMAVRARRRELAQWGFGECRCARCVAEESELREKGEWVEGHDAGEDLAAELKQGLGVV